MTANKFKRNSPVSRAIIILVILCVLFFGFQVIFHYGSNISGEILKETVSSQTNDQYSLNYERIDINVLTKKLEIDNLHLIPNPSLLDSAMQVYEVFVPQLTISLVSILDIYLHRELGFEDIAITNPSIKMKRLRLDHSSTTLSLETGDLYHVINKYLLKFSIDSLGIADGALEYQSQVREEDLRLFFNDIDFHIKNLLIDSASGSSKKFLFTDNISLILSDQQFLMADSIHYIAFDEFTISTASQNVLFKNVVLKRREDKSISEIKGLNHYDIELPELNFRGINFQRAYEKNELILDSVRLLRPSVRIRSFDNIADKPADQKSLTVMLHSLFGAIKISKLYVDEASANLELISGKVSQNIRSGNASLMVEDFVLDSSNFLSPDIPLLYQHLTLTSSDQSYTLSDSSHTIHVNRVQISTHDSLVVLTDVRIDPLKDTEEMNNWIRASIPAANISGYDLRTFSLSKNLDLQLIELESPSLTGKIDFSSLRDNSKGAKNAINIDQLKLSHALIDLEINDQKVAAEDLYAAVKTIKLNQPSNNSLPLLSQLDARNIALQTAKGSLQIAGISAHDQLDSLSISGLMWKDFDQPSPWTISGTKLTGFDLDRYLKNGQIIFDQMIVTNPEFRMDGTDKKNPQSGKLRAVINKTQFNKIQITKGLLHIAQNGRMQTQLDNVSLQLTEFKHDSITNRYSMKTNLAMDSIVLDLPKINHKLRARNISLTRETNQISVGLITLLPKGSADTLNRYSIIGSQLLLNRIEMNRLINDQELLFTSGSLNALSLTASVGSSNSQKSVGNMPLVQFEHFKINNATAQIFSPKIGANIKKINLDIHDFSSQSEHFLKASNYQVDLNAIGIKTANYADSIRIERINGDTRNGNFDIANFDVNIPDELIAHMPQVRVRGLNLDYLLIKNGVRMDSLLFQKPKIAVSEMNNRNEEPSKTPTTAINFTSVEDASISLHHPKITNQDSLKLNHFNMTLNQFMFDTLTHIHLTDHLFESIDISGEEIHYTLPDSLFRLRVKRYSYDHINKIIDLEKIRLEPLYNRGEFQTKIKYQQDWFDGVIQAIHVEQFEIDSLLFRNKLQARSITINQLDLDTHRDKRLPREAGVYKPLPQTSLRNLPLRLLIDTIHILSSFVSHSEFSEKGELPGSIFFRDINGRITNITNDSTALELKNIMSFNSQGTLMNTGDFVLQVKFDLQDTMDQYRLNGRIGPMELTELNRFLEHTAFVQIRDGVNESVTFNFTANEEYAMGDMRFYYDDLKISVLNEESYDTKGLGVSMKTFFANTFVVNTRNPHFLFLRKGNIFHERDTTRSIFNYWGKALLSGVVSSIGAKNNKKEIEAKNEELRKALEESQQPPTP